MLTYVWHYVVARLLYDDLVRPLTRSGVVAVVAAALVVAPMGMWLYRRGARRARGPRR